MDLLLAAQQRLALICPLRFTVRVVRARLRWWADCGKDERGFLIRIRHGLSGKDLLDCLAHEWAHAATWDEEQPHHGPRWGVTYARLYDDLIDHDNLKPRPRRCRH
jgi:hypothetical protein